MLNPKSNPSHKYNFKQTIFSKAMTRAIYLKVIIEIIMLSDMDSSGILRHQKTLEKYRYPSKILN